MQLQLPPKLDLRRLSAFATAVRDATEPVLFTGACAGLDLSADLRDDRAWKAMRELLVALHEGPPTAAFATGAIQGGGVGLVCACDVVVATPDATFALPELLWGLVPGTILPAVRGRVGARGVRSLTMHATAVSAAEAHALGLVDRVAERPSGVLRHLSRLDAGAVRALRRLLHPTYVADVDAGIAASRAQVPSAEVRLARWEAGEVPWSR